MNFGQALDALKSGKCVQRSGWNGKGMYLYLECGLTHATERDVAYEPCIIMFTAQQQHQPGWLASQADMLADDWQVV